MSEQNAKIVNITGNHQLTTQEIDGLKTDFIIADQKIKDLEAEKQSVNASIKSETKKYEEKKEKCRTRIMQGYEERLIECYEERNFTDGIVYYTEIETGEVIQERKMSEKDRQQNLFQSEEDGEPEQESEADVQEVNEMVDEVMVEQESPTDEEETPDDVEEEELPEPFKEENFVVEDGTGLKEPEGEESQENIFD